MTAKWDNEKNYTYWFSEVKNNEEIDSSKNLIFYNNYKNYPIIKNGKDTF